MHKLVIQGEASGLAQGSLACDVIILSIFLWNQIWYGMDMLSIIIPLVLIGVVILLFEVLPEIYCFTETELQVTHKFKKTLQIPFGNVFNYAATTRDAFIYILHRNMVKVYYTDGKQKKVVICRPRNVSAFVDALKENCSEFHDNRQKTKLDVFLDK